MISTIGAAQHTRNILFSKTVIFEINIYTYVYICTYVQCCNLLSHNITVLLYVLAFLYLLLILVFIFFIMLFWIWWFSDNCKAGLYFKQIYISVWMYVKSTYIHTYIIHMYNTYNLQETAVVTKALHMK